MNEYQPVWTVEDFPALDPGSSVAPLEKLQLCLFGVREAECVVALITKRHGSKVAVDKVRDVPTKSLEIELSEAALLGKPAFTFGTYKGYGLNPRSKISSTFSIRFFQIENGPGFGGKGAQ